MPSSIILASASPRRTELLRRLTTDFVVCPSNVPEEAAPGETGAEFAMRAAREKATAVSAELREGWVLGADTVVLLDEEILGKPIDPGDACRMLAKLSGCTHQVVTGVALVDPAGHVCDSLSVATEVEFRELSALEIDAYVASGEPMDKAGAYAIQGGASGFVQRIDGSLTNVVGLPLEEVRAILARRGLLASEPDAKAESRR
jgi:septum formation protein